MSGGEAAARAKSGNVVVGTGGAGFGGDEERTEGEVETDGTETVIDD